MRSIIISIFLLFFITSVAQDITYGVTGVINSTVIPSGSSPSTAGQLESKVGAGGALWVSQRYFNVSLHGNLSLNVLNYFNKDLNSKVTNINSGLILGMKYHIPNFSDLSISGAYRPIFNASSIVSFVGKEDSIADYNISNGFGNRLSHGLYAGIEYSFKDRNSLQVGYTHIINQNYTANFIDAIPHHISIGYNFDFSKGLASPKENAFMINSLLALTKDTLYFMNKSCPTDVSSHQLDSLLALHYTFSAYKILTDEEVNANQRPNAVHYAVFGYYNASLADPSTTGIFLLNSEYNHTQFPYPYHTGTIKFNDGTSGCIGSVYAAAILIRDFNSRLFSKAEIN
jgi:hypothetical protein